MPRGGRRVGTAGKAYGNRTDLQLGPRTPAPVPTTPDQAVAQVAPGAPAPAAPQGPGAPGLVAPGGPGPMTAPVPLDVPSQRPDEPLTSGLPIGAGRTSLPPAQDDPLIKGVSLLNSLGDSASPQVKALRAALSVSQANRSAP